METRPDLDSLCCVNPDCKLFKQKGADNLKVRKVYGRDRIRFLRCRACAQEFSERKGSALFNCKITEAKAASVIDHLDSGCGVVATATLVGVCKDTVSRLLRVCGTTSHSLHDKLVSDLWPSALQFDEKWSFTSKKQKNLSALDDPNEVGDHWDINCIDPTTKLLISLIPGARTAQQLHRAVADAAGRLAQGAGRPAIFTDGEPAYEAAIKDIFGRRYPAPRSSPRGRRPGPIIRVPQDLVYAQVIKRREKGRVKEVEIRPVFGKNKLDRVIERLGWKRANTSAIERFNLTDRDRNARKARKSMNYSRRVRNHDAMSYISIVWYNFKHYHRSLRKQSETGGWEKRTPAMAAGLVDHQFSTLELLRISTIGLG